MKLCSVFVAAVLLAPTAALAAPGVVTASVSMRAGPGPGFPMVDRIPGGARVNIHGCLKGDAWCDVSLSDDRGWVSSRYLKYLYHNRYVYLPDYIDEVDVPVVPFVLNSYWSSYYVGRPWYHRRAHWNGYWRSHARFATHLPADRHARFGRTGTPAAITEERIRPGIAPGAIRPHGFAHVRGAEPGHMQGRFAQPGAGMQAAPRFSAAPAARPGMAQHIAQPGIGRVGGMPMSAHGQMSAPRAAPAMPHMGGSAAHINAAPRMDGGGPASGGGPPGRLHH
jgi:uncharacterized protein YraI